MCVLGFLEAEGVKIVAMIGRGVDYTLAARFETPFVCHMVLYSMERRRGTILPYLRC